MNDRRETWVYGCLCVVLVFGFVFLIINLIFGLFFIIIASLTIAIIYVYRTQEDETLADQLEIPVVSDEEVTEIQTPGDIPFQIQESQSDTTLELEPASQEITISVSTAKSVPEESSAATKELKQRIEELEQRVQSLNEQLAREPMTGNSDPKLFQDEHEKIPEEELSETAIQHLLETLEEKFAKRAISKQLYTRLRDKYIARIEKSKKRRRASAKRGTKTPI